MNSNCASYGIKEGLSNTRHGCDNIVFKVKCFERFLKYYLLVIVAL